MSQIKNNLQRSEPGAWRIRVDLVRKNFNLEREETKKLLAQLPIIRFSDNSADAAEVNLLEQRERATGETNRGPIARCHLDGAATRRARHSPPRAAWSLAIGRPSGRRAYIAPHRGGLATVGEKTAERQVVGASRELVQDTRILLFFPLRILKRRLPR